MRVTTKLKNRWSLGPSISKCVHMVTTTTPTFPGTVVSLWILIQSEIVYQSCKRSLLRLQSFKVAIKSSWSHSSLRWQWRHQQPGKCCFFWSSLMLTLVWCRDPLNSAVLQRSTHDWSDGNTQINHHYHQFHFKFLISDIRLDISYLYK